MRRAEEDAEASAAGMRPPHTPELLLGSRRAKSTPLSGSSSRPSCTRSRYDGEALLIRRARGSEGKWRRRSRLGVRQYQRSDGEHNRLQARRSSRRQLAEESASGKRCRHLPWAGLPARPPGGRCCYCCRGERVGVPLSLEKKCEPPSSCGTGSSTWRRRRRQ